MIWFIFAAANKPKWGFYGILLRLKRQPHCNPSSFHSYYPSCLQPERHNILLAGDVDGRSIEHHDLVQQAGRQFLLHLNLKWKKKSVNKIYFSNNFPECLSKKSCWKRRFFNAKWSKTTDRKLSLFSKGIFLLIRGKEAKMVSEKWEKSNLKKQSFRLSFLSHLSFMSFIILWFWRHMVNQISIPTYSYYIKELNKYENYLL